LAFNGWVKIDAAGVVTIIMAKTEMGQGTHTGLAMLLAEELDADWSNVRVEMSPIDGIYNNLGILDAGPPLEPGGHGLMDRLGAYMGAKVMREFGMMMTGGSSSLKDLWLPMRQAGAAARGMLVAAAAAAWKVPVAEIRVAAGVLSHVSGKSGGFGEFAAAAAAMPLDMEPPLKAPGQFKLIGQPVQRLDSAVKSNGTETFALDVRPQGLLHASVVMCPTPGGTVKSFDAAAALAMPGVRKVVAVDGHVGGTAGVAVVATNTWQALQAAKAVVVDWAPGAGAKLDSQRIREQFKSALSGKGDVFLERGDAAAGMKQAAKQVVAEYWAPYLAHATMEPANCTVCVKDGTAEVWAPTQVPRFARDAVAKVLDLSTDAIVLHQPTLGGGFGRRLEVDYVAQAAQIAKAVPGIPVQTVWSREQDMQHDFYRPACLASFRAGLDAKGGIVAWENTSAGQAITPAYMHRHLGLPEMGADKSTSEGASDQAYEFPAARVAHVAVPLPIPVGFWRSVGHSHQAFFKEGFLDEVAHAAGRDPLDYRLDLLRSHPRQRRILERLAEVAGWREPLGLKVPGAWVGRGVALHQAFGSVVGEVAEVSVDETGTIRVHRVVCVVECGYPVNPNLIRQQVEGSVQFGLAAALHGEVTFAEGRVVQSNFHDYPLLRLHEAPEVVVDILAAGESPQGIGEPAVPPLAPAVANAIFVATGIRLRSLPLRIEPGMLARSSVRSANT
jgi:isoquinoline 1-oxidoreductase beta subunit